MTPPSDRVPFTHSTSKKDSTGRKRRKHGSKEVERHSDKTTSRSSTERLVSTGGNRSVETYGTDQDGDITTPLRRSDEHEEHSRSIRDRHIAPRRFVARKHPSAIRRVYPHTNANANASVLSVSTTMTGQTGISSDSGSTLTQATYNEQMARMRRNSLDGATLETIADDTGSVHGEQPGRLRMYQAFVTNSDDKNQEGDIAADEESSGESMEHWDDVSLEKPNTSSSVSTAPSPTDTRPSSQAIREHREGSVARSDQQALAHLSDTAIDYPESHHGERSYCQMPGSYHTDDGRRSPDMASYPDVHSMRAPPQKMIRSGSASSTHSNVHGHLIEEQATEDSPPAVPDAPDLKRVTLTGYEAVATAISDPKHPLTPIYRKFESLNHRVLLYLQDELSSSEEQLRRLDELIAQSTPCFPDGNPIPSSRRADEWYGAEMHHHRKQLLGLIFIKTQEYNRAMTSYLEMSNSTVKPETEDIEAYKRFMETERHVHPTEAQFLVHDTDLIRVSSKPPPKVVSTVIEQIPKTWLERTIGWPGVFSIMALLLTILAACLSRL